MIAEPSTPPAPVVRARRTSRFTALVGAAVLAVGALAGCGAGQISETAEQRPTTGGAGADIGAMAVRNMNLDSPEGGMWDEGDSVPLTLSIVNRSTSDDTLVSITTDAAEQVLIFANTADYLEFLAAQGESAPTPSASASPTSTSSTSASPSNPGQPADPTPTTAGATETPTGATGNPGSLSPEPGGQTGGNDNTDTPSPSASDGATPSPSPSGAQSPSGVASSSASASASAGQSTNGSVTIPSNTAVEFGYGSTDRPVLLLVGLTRPLNPGETIELTFTFAGAGTGTGYVSVRQTISGAQDAPVLDLHGGGHGAGEGEGEHGGGSDEGSGGE